MELFVTMRKKGTVVLKYIFTNVARALDLPMYKC